MFNEASFVLADLTVDKDHRIIVLGSSIEAKLLFQSKISVLDGAFKAAASSFSKSLSTLLPVLL